MKKLIHLSLLAGSLMFAVPSGAEDQVMIHVDVNAVSDSAEVAPVDGIRSAGQPDARVLALFADAGYVAVIDLRGENEDRGMDEATISKELGLDYIELPLSSPDAISYENAARLGQLLDSLDGPALLHCGSGNRVGALLALLKSSQGASDEAALEYGKSAGLTGLEPVVRARLAEKN